MFDGFLFINKIYRYIKSMKRVEYIMNCRIGKLASMLFLWYRYKLRRLSVLTSIPAKMISNKGFKNWTIVCYRWFIWFYFYSFYSLFFSATISCGIMGIVMREGIYIKDITYSFMYWWFCYLVSVIMSEEILLAIWRCGMKSLWWVNSHILILSMQSINRCGTYSIVYAKV